MLKVFEADYGTHKIRVENRWFLGERLYVNDELQDENLGLGLRANLYGQINTEVESEIIKVRLGGLFKISCKIFVGHKLVDSYIVK